MSQNYITNPFPFEIYKACICFFSCQFNSGNILLHRQTPETALFYIDWAYKKEAWSSYYYPSHVLGPSHRPSL